MNKIGPFYACWLLVVLHLNPWPTEAQQANLEVSRLPVFSNKVYTELSQLRPQENIIFSPFSIQACAAMARIGAKTETAEEMDGGLHLVSSDTQKIAESFHQVLAKYENSKILRIANKIFVTKGAQLREDFKKLLTQQFLSSPENLDFANQNQAAATINQWVQQKTNNLIKELVNPSSLSADAQLMLLNAIYFKGTWVHKFPEDATRSEAFYTSETNSISVPMMNVKKTFGYADLPELDATALQLPYKDSDLSMLIILPKSKTGLPRLENKLRSTRASFMSEITKRLSQKEVEVKLPKFKAEFQVELTGVFQKLGMSRMFTGSADFSGMLQRTQGLKVSAIIHKAFIDVNEHGTEAAAATVVELSPRFLALDPIRFYANHPFTYYLLDKDNNVFFAGKLLKV